MPQNVSRQLTPYQQAVRQIGSRQQRRIRTNIPVKGIVVRGNALIRQGTPQERALERRIMSEYQSAVKNTTYKGNDVRKLAKETSKYNITYYPNGKIQTISAKPVKYVSYDYKREHRSNPQKIVRYSTYVPYEVQLRPDGTIMKEVVRATGEWLYKPKRNTTRSEYKSYDKEVIEYDSKGQPLRVTEKDLSRIKQANVYAYDPKSEGYKTVGVGTKKNVIVTAITDFSKGVKTVYPRPGVRYEARAIERKSVVQRPQEVTVSQIIKAQTAVTPAQRTFQQVFSDSKLKPETLLGAAAYYFNFK